MSLGSIPLLTAPESFFEPWRFVLAPAGLTGWRTRAQDATDGSSHWSGAGQVAGSTATEPRQIILEGYVQGKFTAPGSVEEGLDAIARLSRTTLTVAEDARGLARQADVRVVQMQETRLSSVVAKVTLNLTADDPLRYTAESRVLANGTNLLPNRGDVSAFGRLALTGPHGAISIVHPGGTWTFPALSSGSRLIDFREVRVWNGNVRVFGVGAGPVPRVQSGGSSWTVSGLSTGSAVLSHGEAWS